MRIETHPLGFRKIVLATLGECQLRLHIWPAGTAFQEEKHNHRSWFAGLPLLGTFTDFRYAENSEGEPHQLTVVRSGWAKEAAGWSAHRDYAPSSETGMILRATRKRYPLVPWFCARNAIHSFLPASDRLHVSLVFTGPGKSATCQFWRNTRQAAQAVARDCPSTRE